MRIILWILTFFVGVSSAYAEDPTPTFPNYHSFAYADRTCGANAKVRVFRTASMEEYVVEVWRLHKPTLMIVYMDDPDFAGATLAQFPGQEIEKPMRFYSAVVDIISLEEWTLDAYKKHLGASDANARLLATSCKKAAEALAKELGNKIIEDLGYEAD